MASWNREVSSGYAAAAATAAKSLQSCPTLCDPTDGSPLGSSVPGILQARVLEWGATAFSRKQSRTMEKFIAINKCLVTSVSGEGNGMPLLYSCLENPMDGGAW